MAKVGEHRFLSSRSTGLSDLVDRLVGVLEPARVRSGDAIGEDYCHDEALTAQPHRPDAVVLPRTAAEVSAIIKLAAELGTPVTARGSGTGLSGAANPRAGGILVSFELMNAILEIDTANQVAVVQPGVTLDELDKATAEHGLVYPVFPGELSGSLGGNVGTNAGGMRAVKYGVTRHHVLAVEAVLGTGEVIRSGGKFVKTSTGYDLTQLIVGSEGSLALVTEATLKLQPRLPHSATLLAPFTALEQVTAAVPKIVQSGVGPLILEYIDQLLMAMITDSAQLDLGVPQQVKDTCKAYLVVVLESRTTDRLDEDVAETATLLGELGAADVYVLGGHAGTALIQAREKGFFAAKAAGAHDIIDMVVPRAQIADYLAAIAQVGQETGSSVLGCGHAGDGNVHMVVFQADPEKRYQTLKAVFTAGLALGGAISGEHGIGTEKKKYFLELEDPAKIALMRRIKTAFDPAGVLNPGVPFD